MWNSSRFYELHENHTCFDIAVTIAVFDAMVTLYTLTPLRPGTVPLVSEGLFELNEM